MMKKTATVSSFPRRTEHEIAGYKIPLQQSQITVNRHHPHSSVKRPKHVRTANLGPSRRTNSRKY
jgi:hypothetical protein